jgi:phosphopantetheinyl transferase/malonyl CoA-acyl carrier protein transacylase
LSFGSTIARRAGPSPIGAPPEVRCGSARGGGAPRAPPPLARAAASPAELVALPPPPALRLPDAAHPVARTGAGPCRLALLDPTVERRARARVVLEKGKPWRGREGIFFAPRGLLVDGGKVAFAYPGVDASFKPRLDDVAERFASSPLPVEASEARNAQPRTIEEIGLGLVAAGRLLHDALVALGITPSLALGHSVGEWTGMIATGMIPEAEADAFIAAVRPGTLEVPGVVFAALGCGQERALAAMDGLPSIAVSHDNCPRQVIVCGVEASVDAMLARLRADGVLGQKLPFRSGFHSPLFADFIAPHRANFASLPIATPRLPLWSATSVAPYPSVEADVRKLAIDHLVQPVRFRELAQRLHDEGVRVFVQVGTGSLVGFLEDSLRERPHLAISANVADRPGLEQLERVAAQLFVEGVEPRWDVLWPAAADVADVAPTATPAPSATKVARTIPLALGVPLVEFGAPLALGQVPITPAPPAPPAPAKAVAPARGVAAVFAEMLGAIERASSDVVTLLEQAAAPTARPAPPPPPPQPRERRVVRRLSVETHPWLFDHTFFRQPPGWPVVSDRHPVVPMTTSIFFMMQEAAAFVPGTVAVGIEDVHAFRWLAIPGPTDVAFELRFDGRDRVAVSIDGFAEGTVVLASAYDTAPDAPAPLLAPLVARPNAVPAERPSPLPAERIYVERFMFHGPAYQGIRAVGPVWNAGLRGELECGAAPGALLDNAGQLFGFWMMISAETDRLAMPVGIEKIRFFGPHPRAGARLRCDVRITLVDQRRVIADLTLADAATGKVWCEIGGWEDRRFDTDPRLWNVLIWPERHALAEAQPEGFAHFRDIYRAAATREQLMRRFLGEAERAIYEKIQPRGQRAHLAGRIALKDAVRDFLWKRGHGELFPVEIAVENDANGRPSVRVPGELDLRVSLAHKGDLAVAIVAEGRDVGIDIETIEPRPAGFAGLAFGEDELALRRPGEDEAEFMTRLWTAKEAVGKLLGTGLGGNPRKLKVTDRTGERLLCHGYHVDTRRDGDHVIGWTYAP